MLNADFRTQPQTTCCNLPSDLGHRVERLARQAHQTGRNNDTTQQQAPQTTAQQQITDDEIGFIDGAGI